MVRFMLQLLTLFGVVGCISISRFLCAPVTIPHSIRSRSHSPSFPAEVQVNTTIALWDWIVAWTEDAHIDISSRRNKHELEELYKSFR